VITNRKGRPPAKIKTGAITVGFDMTPEIGFVIRLLEASYRGPQR
jgi:hypothetical protein